MNQPWYPKQVYMDELEGKNWDWAKNKWVHVYEHLINHDRKFTAYPDLLRSDKYYVYAGAFQVDADGKVIQFQIHGDDFQYDDVQHQYSYETDLTRGESFLFWTFIVIGGICVWGTIIIVAIIFWKVLL